MRHAYSKKLLCIIAGIILLFLLLFSVIIYRRSHSAVSEGTADYSVTGLSVNGDPNLWITDDPTPGFSWQMPGNERGKRQKAYRIRVWQGNNIIWDTQKVEADTSAFIPYEGEALMPKTSYTWQVTVWDEEDIPAESEKKAFCTGLMNEGFSNASWIRTPEPAEISSEAEDESTIPERPDTFTIDADFIIEDYSAGFVWGYEDADHGMYIESVNLYPETGTAEISLSFVRKYMIESEMSADITEFFTPEDLQDRPAHITILVKGTHVRTLLNGQEVAGFETDKPRLVSDDFGFRPSRGSTFLVDHYSVRDSAGNLCREEDFSDPYHTIFGNQCIDVTDLMWEGKNRGGWMKTSSSMLLTPGQYYTEKSAPVFQKEFLTEGPVRNAMLYITANGIYDCILDGKKITDTLLNPGNAPYNLRTPYQAYDITDFLGENPAGSSHAGQQAGHSMQVTLGHGWYDRAVGYEGIGAIWGENLGLLAQIEITYEDGTRQIIGTDSTWEVSEEGPVLVDDLWQGEVYDAGRELSGSEKHWQSAEEYTPAWFDEEAGILTLQQDPPVRIIKTLKPVREIPTDRGTIVYDFGQEISGVCKVVLKGPRGSCITMRHGEWLNEEKLLNSDGPAGSVFTKNLLGAQSMDRYFLGNNDEPEEYMPAFTFHGFRYMELLPSDERISILSVEANALASDMKETGTFDSSDELLDRIFENARWSIRGNTVSVPTDCPQRSERFGWTGDAQVISPTAMYMLDAYSFFRDFERDILDVQDPDTGAAPDMAPRNFHTDLTGRGGSGGNNGWGDAVVLIPWNLYQTYGDRTVLEEAYDGMAKWIRYLVGNSENWIRPASGYGDHLSLDTYAYSCINTAWSAHVCRIMSRIAAILGNSADSAEYAEYYNRYRVAWVNNWMLEDGTITAGSESAYVLGLAFELVPDPLRQASASRLKDLLTESDHHLTVGFSGISYVLPVLSEMGYSDIAYQILSEKTYPSFGYQIVHGATTNWEHWRVMNPATDDCYELNGSLNHYAFGSVSLWMPQYLAGIRQDPENPGYKHFYLKPAWELTSSVPFCSASYESVYGKIESSVKYDRSSGKTEYHCSVPANSTAQLVLPVDPDTLSASREPLILEGGKPLQEVEGISVMPSDNNEMVTLELLSGEYSFIF